MPQHQHQAAFLDGAKKSLRVGPTNTQSPGPGEILVKAAAVAINPIDFKIQDTGALYEKWPVVLGCDVAGEVVEVGEGVAEPFSVGSRVALMTHSVLYQKNSYGGFQERVISPVSSAFVLPEGMSYEAAVALPLALATASAALFHPGRSLHLDVSGLQHETPKKSGKTILVWGGSSSVGSVAIQLAVAAGYDVVATASPRNFDLLKELGASAVFDYNSPGADDAIIAELRGKGEFCGAVDAVGAREAQATAAEIVSKSGHQQGGLVATVNRPIENPPEGVAIKPVFAIEIFHKVPELGKKIFQEFLPRALKSGQIKPFPPPKVVGKGVEAIQTGLDQLRAGVSATKVVVTL